MLVFSNVFRSFLCPLGFFRFQVVFLYLCVFFYTSGVFLELRCFLCVCDRCVLCLQVFVYVFGAFLCPQVFFRPQVFL